ncbi:NAD-dependent epimerase/dehydratase family protein [Gelria sp. Kuro-4]|uniref:NAD-dependent epimerase/dehydratase family protein n=1 Tax=Gelria sp. Kuro-4 TaxID=2796927 RepID=UPI001BF17071|nr:NAD-dependent epimerase/dehydratase family protein [Gelria sp. Kuro-4]BCV25988.1 UDP-glucose 4-epimerase [Gelria sp. Kuro-4]
MRVLVTGGAGFIGSHVVEACLAAGHEVAVVDDLSGGKKENLPAGVPIFQVDVADAAAVEKAFESARPEAVIHEAAQISVSRSVREPGLDARTNVLGLLNVLEAAVRQGVRAFVFASSGGVLYGDVFEPAAEEHPAAPVSPYGIAKLAGEMYLAFFAREHGLRCAALRYGNVYGPRQDPHGEAGVVAIFLERFLAGAAPIINGDGRYIRDYVYVEDVARANLLALEGEWEGFRAYNVGTGRGTDVNELERGLRSALTEILREQGRKPALPAATYGPPRPGDLRSSLLDAGKIARELGWRPQVALEEGLKRTAAWFADRRNRNADGL